MVGVPLILPGSAYLAVAIWTLHCLSASAINLLLSPEPGLPLSGAGRKYISRPHLQIQSRNMFYLVQLLVQIEFRYLFPVNRRGLKLVSGGIIQIGVLLMISFRTETVHLINIQWILGRELYTRLGILEF